MYKTRSALPECERKLHLFGERYCFSDLSEGKNKVPPHSVGFEKNVGEKEGIYTKLEDNEKLKKTKIDVDPKIYKISQFNLRKII